MAKKLLILFFTFLVQGLMAQTTYLPTGSSNHDMMDKLETLSGKLCDSIFLSNKPESRKSQMEFLGRINQNAASLPLSKIDKYNMEQAAIESSEWAENEGNAFQSKHPIGNFVYKNPYDMVHVTTKDLVFVLNPVIAGTAIFQYNSPNNGKYSNMVLCNSHGVEARGWITKKIGFYTYFADNQDVYPSYIYELANKKRTMAVPGADFFLLGANYKNYFDYLQASGYFDFAVIKNHLNITFGYGKHFIGDGLSSLFLTDFSANTPFMQVQTKIWKFDYECLYLGLMPQYNKTNGDKVLSEKFSTMHYISFNATRWLNLGFFESVVFDRPNYYDVSYLNPIMLTMDINHYTGNGDKALLGLFWKTLIARRMQFYGQFMLNEFKSKEFFGNRGWWGNKWGLQLGGKYFNALGIKNLDLQAELNIVRPYTYEAKDTLANYTNYNQPLADPLGAGFIRGVGLAKWQPFKKLFITGKLMYYIQGMDTGSASFGNNIFNAYVIRNADYGIGIINGPQNHCTLAELSLSYRIMPNLYFDLGATYRSYVSYNNLPGYATTGPINGDLKTVYFNFGIRLNAAKRDYNFF
jgi:hypothetical protein